MLDSEEDSFDSEDDCTIEELRLKLRESQWETVDALRHTLKALEERNEYRDMVIELQDLLREALGKLEYWSGIVKECERIVDDPVDSNSGD